MPQPQQQIPFQDSVYTPTRVLVPTRGCAPDLSYEAAGQDYFVSALNFVVRNGRVTRREGAGPTLAIGASGAFANNIFGAYEWIPYNASAILVISTINNVYYYDTAANNFVVITQPTGAPNASSPIFWNPMRTASSGLRLISSQSRAAIDVTPPIWWTGNTASTFVVLTTAVIGSCAITWKSHFLQGDTVDTGDGHVACRVHWSALGDPTVWSGTASAGNIDLLDNDASAVRQFLPLQQELLAYKDEGVYTLTYKASPFYFTQQLRHAGLTMVAAGGACVVEGGDRHFVFTKDGAILWDGQTVFPVGRNRVDRTILSRLTWPSDSTSIYTIQSFYSPSSKEIVLLVPMDGSLTPRVWVYNTIYDSWWESDLPITHLFQLYRTFSSGAPRVYAAFSWAAPWATNGAHLQRWDSSAQLADQSGALAVTSSLETGLWDFGTDKGKETNRLAIYAGPVGVSSTTMLVQTAGVENPAALTSVTYATAQTLSVTNDGSRLPIIDYRQTARWHGFRLSHSAAGHSVQIHSLNPRLTPRSDIRRNRA